MILTNNNSHRVIVINSLQINLEPPADFSTKYSSVYVQTVATNKKEKVKVIKLTIM